jgi:tight adherence protein C
MELLVAAAAGLAVFLIVVFAVSPRRPGIVQARLGQFGTTQADSLEELELRQPLFDRTLRPLFNRLSSLATRISSPSNRGRSERRLATAGNPGGLRAVDFLGLKALSGILLGGATFLLLGAALRSPLLGALATFAAAGVGWLLPEFWLGGRISRRQRQIVRALPDTIDLLTISVRAGLGFDSALAKVVEKTRGPLADEIRRSLSEIRVGKTRRDALRDLVTRVQVESLTTFVGAVIQADQLGVSISKVLQVQSEQLRIERRQRAEELANKAPIKMLFPLVGCIFPSMFIVILGPAIILIMLNMSAGT